MKRLLLSIAAIAAVVSGPALAQDMPSRNRPLATDYVRVCDWITEAGFYVIPGTDTCIHTGGYVRGQYNVQSTGNAFGPSGKLGLAYGGKIQKKSGSAVAIIAPPATSPVKYLPVSQDNQGSLGRAELVIDARTPTSMGPLRVLLQLQFDHGWGTQTPSLTPQILDKVYMQWAGLTAGRAESFFKFYDNLTDSSYIGLRALIPSSTLFAYTVPLGNGLQVSASAEDPQARQGGILQAKGSGPGSSILTKDVATAGTYGAFRSPDVVGQIKLEQAWGKAQLSAVWHRSIALYGAGTLASPLGAKGVDGYAALAGVNVNLPLLAPGDFLLVQGAYARGANAYLGAGTSVNDPGASFLRSDSDFFINAATGQTQASKGYNLIANLRHYWTPTFWQALYGSYTQLTPGTNARLIDWTIGGIAGYRELRVSSQFVWAPVKSFSIGFEAMYENTKNTLAGAGTNAPPLGYKKDYDSWIGRFRINRIF